ncbi:MAG: hypothetical protein WCF90_04830 [Methanomicrobiales archaeon]
MVICSLALLRQETYVRYLISVETLGSTSVFVSDKTGTITKGRLSVWEVQAIGRESLLQAAVLCNDAREDAGDPVDLALLLWAEKTDGIWGRNPRFWVFPFDTKKKFLATVTHAGTGYRFSIKGAYEELHIFAENAEDFYGLGRALDDMAEKGLRVLAFTVRAK